MKTTNFFWGIGLLLLAVVLILNALGIPAPLSEVAGGITLLQVALGLFLICFAFARLVKGHLAEIFFPLSLVFMLFEKNIATLAGREDPNIINNWLLLGCVVLISIGLSLLFPKRDKDSHFHVLYNDSQGKRGGSSTRYIDCADFKQSHVENNLGSYTVHFENTEAYRGGGILHIENNLGAVTVHVPSSWRVDVQIDNSLGSVAMPKPQNTDGPLLVIMGENNLGKISILLT